MNVELLPPIRPVDPDRKLADGDENVIPRWIAPLEDEPPNVAPLRMLLLLPPPEKLRDMLGALREILGALRGMLGALRLIPPLERLPPLKPCDIEPPPPLERLIPPECPPPENPPPL